MVDGRMDTAAPVLGDKRGATTSVAHVERDGQRVGTDLQNQAFVS